MIDLEQSLIKLYENRYKLKLEKAERSISCSVIHPKAPNNYFDNEVPLTLFILDGTIVCEDGKVVEIEKSYYRGDRYKFSVSAKPQIFNKKSLSNTPHAANYS